MRKNKGFTLIELLVVMAIISILAGMIMVGINSARARAQVATTKTLIANLCQLLEVYQNQNHQFPDPGKPDDAGRDNPQGLYAALCNLPEFGGSEKGAPLFVPKDQDVGILIEADNSEEEGTTSNDPSEEDFGDGTPTGSPPNDDLVIRDSWGNFIHYVEWLSRTNNKTGNDYWGNEIKAKHNSRESYTMWSDGQNSINEQGEEDDINNTD